MKTKIGIMGGSFNPIHNGHVALARTAIEQAGLEKVLFIPTGNPPHKLAGLAPASMRYDMTRLAIAGEEGLVPCDIEVRREGMTFTVDTLRQLQGENLDASFYFIIGEDTLGELPKWREPAEVAKRCTFLVARRPRSHEHGNAGGEQLQAMDGTYSYLEMPQMDVSATAIRNELATGKFSSWLHPAVAGYIHGMGLYGVQAPSTKVAQAIPRLMETLSMRRMGHSLCVMTCAMDLASCHGLSREKAALAAVLHDCAKEMPLGKMQALCSGMVVEPHILSSPFLLHGMAGAALASREYNVQDEEVLSAITCHTVGKVNMTKLDMVLFLADKIEATRNYPGVTAIRENARENLYAAMALSIQRNLDHLKEKGKYVDPATYDVLQWVEGQ